MTTSLRSEAIADEIMSEIHESVKELIVNILANRKTLIFGEIESEVQSLSRKFGELLSQGALEAIGNGYVGRAIDRDCSGNLEYHGDRQRDRFPGRC